MTVLVAVIMLLGAAGAATVSAKTHHATGKAKAPRATAGGSAHVAAASRTTGKLVYRGTVNLAAIAAQSGSATGPPGRSIPGRKASPLHLKSSPLAAQPAPNPAPTPILSQPGPELASSASPQLTRARSMASTSSRRTRVSAPITASLSKA